MESVHLNIQDGAKVVLYLDAVSDGGSLLNLMLSLPLTSRDL